MDRQAASTPAHLGAIIRAARRAAHITQTELADRAGVSRRWLIMVEQGDGATAELGKIMATLSALGLRLTIDDTPPALNATERALTDLLGGGAL
jgi:transcriptional regulator with XRE-family HTH domain